MWKIIFEYADKSKCTITGKHKDIPLELAVKYQKQYHSAKTAIYWQYPMKNHDPMILSKKIKKLQESEVVKFENHTMRQQTETKAP